MCGIAGIIDQLSPPDEELLQKMAQPLVCRGPDDSGHYLNGIVGLIHQRLSIIDLECGKQPMFNEDGSLVVIFNGEIYDYESIRTRLIAKGHRLSTKSDTEVLLHLFEEYGVSMLDHLNGMFAFAIYNILTKELFFARDRFGQKPLFYSQSGPRLAIGSGPKSLASIEWVDTTIDMKAIHDYLEFQCIPGPRSIFLGIRKLAPGHYGYWKDGQLTILPYWTPSVTGDYGSGYNEAKIELLQTLESAVSKRLVADVPLGIFLSGGLDSSIICAIAKKQQSGAPLHSFSIGFPEKEYDEREFSSLAAEHLGTDHHFLEVVPNRLDDVGKIVGTFEEPFCDSSMLPTALLSRFTRSHVKVSLGGDGADELFGGYYRYRVLHLLSRVSRFPSSMKRAVRRTILATLPLDSDERSMFGRIRRLVDISDQKGLRQYLSVISRVPDSIKRDLYTEELNDNTELTDSIDVLLSNLNGDSTSTSIDKIMELELNTYLPNDILAKVDRASMAFGLEVRSPFLDVDVATLAMKFPYSWKQSGRVRKKILIDTFQHLLPNSIINRAKLGFGVPVARWLRSEWRDPVTSILLDDSIVTRRFFRRDRIENLLDLHMTKKADYSYLLYALLVLELWMNQNEV